MNASFAPVCALLVHTPPGARGGGPMLVTAHPVRAARESQPPMLDAGRILGRDDVDELVALLRDPESQARGGVEFLPPNILLAAPNRLCWFQPAMPAKQYWRTPEGMVLVNAVLPPLVFTATRHGLFVVALASDQYPSRATATFHAPLGNVHAHTGVCLGSAVAPRTLAPSSAKDWTYVLLGTNYTHVNHRNTLAGGATTEQLIAFWQRRQRTATPPSKRFLSPTGMTLGQWVERVSDPDKDRL